MMKMTLMPNEEKRRNSRLPCPARKASVPRCCWAERRVGGTGSPESERSEEVHGSRQRSEGGSVCRGGGKWRRWWPCPSRLAPAPPASLSRLRVEKIEGGLMVAGVLVAANCRIALPAFGCLFLLAGAVLTAAAYRGQGIGEDSDHYAARVAFTGNSRVLGPACLVVGFLMAAIGVGLCFLTRRAREREGERRARRVGFHCPIHGDFWAAAPETMPNSPSNGGGTRRGTLVPTDKPASKRRRLLLSLCPRGVGDEDEEERGLGPNLVPPPLCPHSALSSTRSSLSNSWQPEAAASPGAASRCPTPVPFVMSCSISSGMANSLGPGVGISPDHTAFGSIRSLSVSREVASFPLSRTPSPPPVPESLPAHIVQPNMMAPEDCPGHTNANLLPLITIPCTHPVKGENEVCLTVLPPLSTEQGCSIPAGPRKSVSILLPTDEESGQKRNQPPKFEDDKVREEKG
ncbi:uncharacterized protein LOC124169052 isoform X2 [Ischnura elegans]|uniref:uncharacterized protein LOC124169052 isoform X2 n=1 Tax=Ischnura elegans TaxID=197161 RepID=UPI001ED8751F|nr:uncharacterized protein LOC124169052 isoform X2 [Ischnura elegans]